MALRRWLPVAAAGLASALLAAGFGIAANEFVSPRTLPAPQLKTVSRATLARLGLSLSAPTQPPYCGLANVAVGRGWLRPGSAECAIGRAAAESAAERGGRGHTVESVLALVTSSPIAVAAVGRDHLTWLVVTQRMPGTCRSVPSAWSVACGARRFATSQLVLVDARTAWVVNAVRLSTAVVQPAAPFPAPVQPG